MADGRRGTIDERELSPNLDRFIPVPDFQAEVAHQRATDFEPQVLDDFGSEAVR
jgi:hypothetical protein